MLRLAISRWLAPEILRLDIGCDHLTLQYRKQMTTCQLPIPLRSGIPQQEALDGLRSAISGLCAGMTAKKRVMEVTLSDALVRGWIVERLPGLASPAEVEALADFQMRALYGDDDADASDWVIRVDATPFAKNWPAMALPKVLRDLLVGIAGDYGCPLARIQTRFVFSFNDWQDHPFKRSNPIVLSLDTPDGLTIGIRNAAQWQALRTHPPLAILGVGLPAMLRRECRAAGLHLDDCKIHSLPWQFAEKSA